MNVLRAFGEVSGSFESILDMTENFLNLPGAYEFL